MYPPPKSSNPGASVNMAVWLTCCSSLCLKPSPWRMEKARRNLGWLPAGCHKRASGGFTLAELLISLAILGVIATFTIPKILTANQNRQQNAAAKEVAGMIMAAYQQHKLNGLLSSSTKSTDFTPYMNYVQVVTTGQLDDMPGANSSVYDCGGPFTCLKLHNGGTLAFHTTNSFGGTNTTNILLFIYDPDSIRIGVAADGPSKSLLLFLHYQGQLKTKTTISPSSIDSSGFPHGPAANGDPSWFSWN